MYIGKNTGPRYFSPTNGVQFMWPWRPHFPGPIFTPFWLFSINTSISVFVLVFKGLCNITPKSQISTNFRFKNLKSKEFSSKSQIGLRFSPQGYTFWIQIKRVSNLAVVRSQAPLFGPAEWPRNINYLGCSMTWDRDWVKRKTNEKEIKRKICFVLLEHILCKFSAQLQTLYNFGLLNWTPLDLIWPIRWD